MARKKKANTLRKMPLDDLLKHVDTLTARVWECRRRGWRHKLEQATDQLREALHELDRRPDTEEVRPRVDAIAFDSADEAIQHTYAAGRGEAIRIARRCVVVSQADADRLAAAGIDFAYLADCELPDGSHRIVTIPAT